MYFSNTETCNTRKFSFVLITPPENIYTYFRKLLKGVTRNTQIGIISNRQKTDYNFDDHHLEPLGEIIL